MSARTVIITGLLLLPFVIAEAPATSTETAGATPATHQSFDIIVTLPPAG